MRSAGGSWRVRLAVEQARSRSRSLSAARRLACSVARLSVELALADAFSSASSSVSSAIWALSRFSTVSLPVISAAEQELHQDEDREQEDEDEEQVRQDVDEARPVLRAAPIARRCAPWPSLLAVPGSAGRGRWSRAAPASRAAARTGSRPSCGPPAARCACAGRGPGCPRRGWPWPWWRAGSSRRRLPDARLPPSWMARDRRSIATRRSSAVVPPPRPSISSGSRSVTVDSQSSRSL